MQARVRKLLLFEIFSKINQLSTGYSFLFHFFFFFGVISDLNKFFTSRMIHLLVFI